MHSRGFSCLQMTQDSTFRRLSACYSTTLQGSSAQPSGSLMETRSCWIHIDEANGATEDREERVTPTSTRRQQRGEEYKQVKAAGILGVPSLLFALRGTNAGRSSRQGRLLPGSSAFERRVEAASAVDGFGARRLSSLLPQLLSTQSAAEPSARRLVLLIERSCRERRERSIIIKFTSNNVSLYLSCTLSHLHRLIC